MDCYWRVNYFKWDLGHLVLIVQNDLSSLYQILTNALLRLSNKSIMYRLLFIVFGVTSIVGLAHQDLKVVGEMKFIFFHLAIWWILGDLYFSSQIIYATLVEGIALLAESPHADDVFISKCTWTVAIFFTEWDDMMTSDILDNQVWLCCLWFIICHDWSESSTDPTSSLVLRYHCVTILERKSCHFFIWFNITCFLPPIDPCFIRLHCDQ